jgi:hypothetical protein
MDRQCHDGSLSTIAASSCVAYQRNMLGRRDAPFPVEAVRDLLGLCRAIYRSERDAGAPQPRLDQIQRAGRMLNEAIDLYATAKPNTVGMRAAWARAEDGTRATCELVDLLTPAQPIVEASMRAVRGHCQ